MSTTEEKEESKTKRKTDAQGNVIEEETEQKAESKWTAAMSGTARVAAAVLFLSWLAIATRILLAAKTAL